MPAMSETVGVAAHVKRAPVWVNGTAYPNKIEREKLRLLGLSITSAPASVANLPPIAVNWPEVVPMEACVMSTLLLLAVGNDAMMSASDPNDISILPLIVPL